MVKGCNRSKNSVFNEAALSDSAIRAAALPVGAASATFSELFIENNTERSFATVVVLPVPGPPVMIVKLLRAPEMTAAVCQGIRPDDGDLPMDSTSCTC